MELLGGKNNIPRYISHFYDYVERDFKLEDLDIGEIYVLAFYAHKGPNSDEAEIAMQVQVKVRIVFEPEPNLEELQQYIEFNRTKHFSHLDNFDGDGRQVYDGEMSFLISLTFSEQQQAIASAKFITFFSGR